jgi:hypothetical protein
MPILQPLNSLTLRNEDFRRELLKILLPADGVDTPRHRGGNPGCGKAAWRSSSAVVPLVPPHFERLASI